MGKQTIETNPDGTGGTLSLSTPDLSDEESHDVMMPKHFRCDACNGISVRINKLFKEKILRYPSISSGKKRLSEQQVSDVVESVCENGDWEGFGVKNVEGKSQLVYPGAPHEETPGISMMGGMWSSRFNRMCQEILGDFDEDEIYLAYQKCAETGVFKMICTKLCNKKPKKTKKVKQEL